jgi:hypothetical protein
MDLSSMKERAVSDLSSMKERAVSRLTSRASDGRSPRP